MRALHTSAAVLAIAPAVLAVGCDDGSNDDAVEPLGTIELYNGDSVPGVRDVPYQLVTPENLSDFN